MGAVNGITTDGKLIVKPGNQQVREVWTGATFSVAAFMLHDGMKEEAFHTVWGVYNVVYDKKGFWFRTPEPMTRMAIIGPPCTCVRQRYGRWK